MTSAGETVTVRRGKMVGPPYLYRGAQVCGWKTGRTCIFLLASFGVSCSLIGLVFFTADLRMESGLWAGGLALMCLGVMLVVWFLVLCCAARAAYLALPPAHPARTKPSRPVLVPAATSTPAYQLLPLNHPRGHTQGLTPPPPGHSERLLNQTSGSGYSEEANGSFTLDKPPVLPYGYSQGAPFGMGGTPEEDEYAHNGSWGSYSLRRPHAYHTPFQQLNPIPGRTAGYPVIQTWDYRIGRDPQSYPGDRESWSTMTRLPPQPRHHQEFPASHIGGGGGVYTSCPSPRGVLLPGAEGSLGLPARLEVSPGGRRHDRVEDHPPRYCDVVPQ